MKVLAAAIDLGTTRIKAGLLREDGALQVVASREAPPLSGEGLLRESDPEAFLEEVARVTRVLEGSAPSGTPMGLASQRSTFTIWEGASGAPRTPLISWQDRRAAPWCVLHAGIDPVVRERTGLRLSPHYAGPKLATLLEGDVSLRRGMEEGAWRFGTIDCWVLSRLADGSPHETDPTMAARTLLADGSSGAWAPDLLRLFSVPAGGLPGVVPTAGREPRRVGNLRLTASLADQAAALLAAAGVQGDDALINLGTGGFVLRTTGPLLERPEGYLAGPILAARGGPSIFAAEGTINGAAEALARFGSDPSPPARDDPTPAAFCIPDLAGLGAPHWIPDRTLTFSPAAMRLDPSSKRRIVLEGILFRVREILEGLFAGSPPGRLIVSGGVAPEPGLAEGLAACLERPVECLDEPEATLLGAARLAAGLPPCDPPPRTRRVEPGAVGRYLPAKWERWRGWMAADIDG